MTFFERQQAARRKTAILLLAFMIAVLLVCAAVNAAGYVLMSGVSLSPPTLAEWLAGPHGLWVSAATLAVIGFGSARATLRLRHGGRVVAELVGARPLDPAGDTLAERRLVNVVEEMAIASGSPVPDLYVMDSEAAINAFVTGSSPGEAALVVTAGTLANLDRDELQGVIAHEFSHILSGDMQINVRLMGVLAGLELIGRLGRVLLRSGGRRGRRSRGQAGVAGLILLVIGYIGLFFGSLIKAAISRQREFLADATAVQFTRNPQGIAGALAKIANEAGGALLSPHCEEISHFCFAQAISSRFALLMATHPPIEERIRAIDPLFELRRKQRERARQARQHPPGATVPASGADLIERCGRIEPGGIAFAGTLLAALPERLRAALHTGAGARGVIFALLLAELDRAHLERARERLERDAGPDALASAEPLIEQIRGSGRRARLPLVNMALPALKRLDSKARAELLHSTQLLIEADDRYSVFEFAVLVVLRAHLGDEAHKTAAVRFHRFADVSGEIHLLLSVMARVGSRDEAAIAESFRFAMGQFDRSRREPLPRAACTLNAVGAALQRLGQLAPLLKGPVLQAATDCVTHDGKLLVSEADLLQAVAASLGCPLPPLVPPGAGSDADSSR